MREPGFSLQPVGVPALVSADSDCYITGPFFLLAAVYVVAEFHRVLLQPGRFLLVVFVVSVAACLTEFPLGGYTKEAETQR